MNQTFKKMNRKDFNYSQIGEASAKKYLYLLNRKKHLNNLLKGMKRNKIISDDYIDQEENDVYDDLYEKDVYEEDIFDKDYKNKYMQILEEQKQKYFNLKKSCSLIENNERKDIRDSKKGSNLKISKKQLLDKFYNDKFKYHLIHHHHDYYLDKSLINAGGAEPACTSYNPKMEYIYKKIIYSPEFNKMSGRYDNDNLKDKIEKQKENHIKQKKEKESKIHLKKLEKMRKSIIMPKKESDLNYDEIDNLMNIVKRHNSLVERRNSSMISILKRPSQDKEGNDNNKNNNDESKIIDKKFFKRMHSMIYEGTHSFGLINHNNNKNSLESIKNIEEDEKEEHYDIF